MDTMHEGSTYEKLPRAVSGLDRSNRVKAALAAFEDCLREIKLDLYRHGEATSGNSETRAFAVTYQAETGTAKVQIPCCLYPLPVQTGDVNDEIWTWIATQLGVGAENLISAQVVSDPDQGYGQALLQALAETYGVGDLCRHRCGTELVSTVARRLAYKGTANSYRVMGRILGYDYVHYRPLWTRLSPRCPQDPGDASNLSDMRANADELPTGDQYRADLIDDSDQFWSYSMTGTSSTLAANIYLHNAYVSPVGVKVRSTLYSGDSMPVVLPSPGSYFLSGGSEGAFASVELSAAVSGLYGLTLRAIAPGSGFNGICATVSGTGATRTVSISGQLSAVKYRSNYFDLCMGIDADKVDQVPVGLNADLLAAADGDARPKLADGSRISSGTELDFGPVLAMANADTQVWATLKPATRWIRSQQVGIVVSDSAVSSSGYGSELDTRSGMCEFDAFDVCPSARPMLAGFVPADCRAPGTGKAVSLRSMVQTGDNTPVLSLSCAGAARSPYLAVEGGGSTVYASAESGLLQATAVSSYLFSAIPDMEALMAWFPFTGTGAQRLQPEDLSGHGIQARVAPLSDQYRIQHDWAGPMYRVQSMDSGLQDLGSEYGVSAWILPLGGASVMNLWGVPVTATRSTATVAGKTFACSGSVLSFTALVSDSVVTRVVAYIDGVLHSDTNTTAEALEPALSITGEGTGVSNLRLWSNPWRYYGLVSPLFLGPGPAVTEQDPASYGDLGREYGLKSWPSRVVSSVDASGPVPEPATGLTGALHGDGTIDLAVADLYGFDARAHDPGDGESWNMAEATIARANADGEYLSAVDTDTPGFYDTHAFPLQIWAAIDGGGTAQIQAQIGPDGPMLVVTEVGQAPVALNSDIVVERDPGTGKLTASAGNGVTLPLLCSSQTVFDRGSGDLYASLIAATGYATLNTAAARDSAGPLSWEIGQVMGGNCEVEIGADLHGDTRSCPRLEFDLAFAGAATSFSLSPGGTAHIKITAVATDLAYLVLTWTNHADGRAVVVTRVKITCESRTVLALASAGLSQYDGDGPAVSRYGLSGMGATRALACSYGHGFARSGAGEGKHVLVLGDYSPPTLQPYILNNFDLSTSMLQFSVSITGGGTYNLNDVVTLTAVPSLEGLAQSYAWQFNSSTVYNQNAQTYSFSMRAEHEGLYAAVALGRGMNAISSQVSIVYGIDSDTLFLLQAKDGKVVERASDTTSIVLVGELASDTYIEGTNDVAASTVSVSGYGSIPAIGALTPGSTCVVDAYRDSQHAIATTVGQSCTVEAWIYVDSYGSSYMDGNQTIFKTIPLTNTYHTDIEVYINEGNLMLGHYYSGFAEVSGGLSHKIVTLKTQFTTGRWFHVACVRVPIGNGLSATLLAYFHGNRVEIPDSSPPVMTSVLSPWAFLGARVGGAKVYVEDLRISRGARYTGDTYEVPPRM